MKKLHYLYADFETTQVPLPDKYENYKDYYEQELKPREPKVYSWAILYNKNYGKLGENNFSSGKVLDDEYNFNYDISGESFIKYIENIKVDALMFFNNLKGFDGHFIIPLLDRSGYYNVLPLDIENYIHLSEQQKIIIKDRMIRIKTDLLNQKFVKNMYDGLKKLSPDKANEYMLYLVKKNWNLLYPKEYSVITNGSSKIYEIKIGIKGSKKTKGKIRNRAFIIRDNLLLFPSSVAKMGETIMHDHIATNYDKNFRKWKKENKKKTQKLSNLFLKKEISGGYDRTELYKNIDELKNDGNELDYLIQDTYILWKFHNVIEKIFPRKKWKMTIGATSYKLWQTSFGKSIEKMYYEKGEIDYVELSRGAKRIQYKDKLYSTFAFKKKMVNKILPCGWMGSKVNDYETHYDVIYKYYYGGMSFVNELYRGQLVTGITFIDINSSYPSQMVKEVLVPIGKGLMGDVENHPFKFYKLTPKVNIYNKDGLPFLHNEYAAKREYLTTLRPNTQYRFTSITLPRFLKYYKCDPDDYELEVEYSFMQMSIGNIFGDFITSWYDVKEQAAKNGDDILKFIAKLFMNNVYGKFATKIERDSKIWNQETQEWDSYIQQLDPEYYLPIGIAIAELGRMSLVDGVDHNYNKIVYGDTDSIAVIDYKPEEFKNIELHPSKIGKWDIEFKNGVGVFRRSKQYMLINETKHKMAFSGINFNKFIMSDKDLKDLSESEKKYRKLSLKDFILGKSIDNQLRPYQLLGSGLILEELEKEIKPVWWYPPLTQQKFFLKEHFIHNLEKIDKLKKNSI